MSNESSTTTRRRYQQRKRAELQEQTRRRITQAAVELHGSVGPARTTISAIAERAGVRRATVYAHFPDERSLFQACSGLWAAEHPPPDPAEWAGIDDPEARLETALDALYGWYEQVENMLANVMRDAPSMPILREIGAQRIAYVAAVEDGLARGWGARGRRARLLRAAISLAVDFTTWQSMRRRGLERSEAVALMAGLVRANA